MKLKKAQRHLLSTPRNDSSGSDSASDDTELDEMTHGIDDEIASTTSHESEETQEDERSSDDRHHYHHNSPAYLNHHSSTSHITAPRPILPYQPAQVHLEFNDGTISPLPSDLRAYFHDDAMYHAAYTCMTEAEENEWYASDDYIFWLQKLESQQGKLVVETSDLNSVRRWQALAFFLAKSHEVSSVRFHGVDLQKRELLLFTDILLKCALANHVRRPRKRANSASPVSSSPNVSSSSAGTSPVTNTNEWTSGWGYKTARARHHDLRLKNITFTDNNIGTNMHYSDEELARRRDSSDGNSNSSTSTATALDNVISFLLFCELLETCAIWRNNLSDQHAIKLCEAILLKHPSLRNLSLRYNGITIDGAQKIEEILQTMKANVQASNGKEGVGGAQFQKLDLAFNRIDPTRAKELFKNSSSSTSPTTSNSLPTSSISSTNRQINSTTNNTSSSSINVPTTPAQPLPPRRPLYSVNLRSQMPPSARMLSHYLRLTVPATPRYDACAKSGHRQSGGGHVFMPLQTISEIRTRSVAASA